MLEYSEHGPVDAYINTPLALAFTIGAIIGPVAGIMLCERNPVLDDYVRCFDLANPELQFGGVEVQAGLAGQAFLAGLTNRPA
jgi:hypothetical protein